MFKEFQEICRQRHSVRSFTPQPVSDEQVRQILEVVQMAPTAGNLQAFEVVLVKDPSTIKELAQAAKGQQWITAATVVLAFVALPGVSAQKYAERGRNLYALQDASIACTVAQLAIQALGLATTWVGAFDDNEVHRILHCQDDQRPVAMLPIGYRATEPKATSRRPLTEIVREL